MARSLKASDAVDTKSIAPTGTGYEVTRTCVSAKTTIWRYLSFLIWKPRQRSLLENSQLACRLPESHTQAQFIHSHKNQWKCLSLLERPRKQCMLPHLYSCPLTFQHLYQESTPHVRTQQSSSLVSLGPGSLSHLFLPISFFRFSSFGLLDGIHLRKQGLWLRPVTIDNNQQPSSPSSA